MRYHRPRNTTIRIPGRVRLDPSGIRVHIRDEPHHRLQPDQKFAGPEDPWRKFHRNLDGAGEQHRQDQTPGPDLVLLLHSNFVDPEGNSPWTFTRAELFQLLRGRGADEERKIVFQTLKDVKVSNRVLKKSVWFLGTGRNAIVVILCAVISYVYENRGGAPFVLTGHIEAGLPSVQPPPFSRTVGNQTETFMDMCKNLGTGILIVPLISIIGNVAIAKAFCKFSREFAAARKPRASGKETDESYCSARPNSRCYPRNAYPRPVQHSGFVLPFHSRDRFLLQERGK